jgi:hypothetical protein
MAVSVDNRAQARAAVMMAATVIADPAHARIDDVVAALESLQYDSLSAERLALLVPLAFGRVALKAKGVEHFAWTVRIDADDDVVLQLDLKDEPVFLEALRYAVESFEGQGASEAVFARVASNSAEMGAAAKAEQSGEDVAQARIHETAWRSRLPCEAWQAHGARESVGAAFPDA